MSDIAASSTPTILTNVNPIAEGERFAVVNNHSLVNRFFSEYSTEIQNLKNMEENVDYFSCQLIEILKRQDFEYGYFSEADKYIENILQINTIFAKEIINRTFISKIEDEKVLLGLLQLVGHCDYMRVYPVGQTIAIASLSFKNVEIKEAGIRAFENWNRKETAPILKRVEAGRTWLDEYLASVIKILESGE